MYALPILACTHYMLQLQVLLYQQVVLLAEQLDLLCELGLVGASRCRHETVDTILQ